MDWKLYSIREWLKKNTIKDSSFSTPTPDFASRLHVPTPVFHLFHSDFDSDSNSANSNSKVHGSVATQCFSWSKASFVWFSRMEPICCIESFFSLCCFILKFVNDIPMWSVSTGDIISCLLVFDQYGQHLHARIQAKSIQFIFNDMLFQVYWILELIWMFCVSN